MHNSSWVSVYVAPGRLAAEMIRAFLESYEIPARLSQESAGAAIGLTIGELGEVEILVPSDQEKKARDILIAMEAGQFENGNSEDVNKSDESENPTKP